MAEGRIEAPVDPARKTWLWTEIFRSFQIALDPRKLVVAGAGILAMSFGWYLLSAMFYYDAPKVEDLATKYTERAKKKLGEGKTEAEYASEAKSHFDTDYQQWQTLNSLAGKDGAGALRVMPWNEYRGENPITYLQKYGFSIKRILDYMLSMTSVITEPINKLFNIILHIVDPTCSFQTRIYLLLCLLTSVGVWAFFGGIITRIAAIQFAGRERISLKQAIKFVCDRYVSYVLSPLVPLIVISVIIICMSVYGLVALIPGVGDIVMYGLLLPLIVIGGIVMSILLLGLVGYPMMSATVSTEGSDTFDALSRSYNYVFQAPWQYLWYTLVSVLYGAAVSFIVILVGCMMVYLGKWAVSQPASAVWTDRKPDYLFRYSPKSLGWRELMLRGSPAELNPLTQEPKNKEAADKYLNENDGMGQWHHQAGAGLVAFWMVLIFLMMIGFTYSYFWTASTMIYMLMRKKVDEVELDEIFPQSEAENFAPPMTPPAPVSPVQSSTSVSLPTVPPPPPAVVPPPPATTTPPATEPTK